MNWLTIAWSMCSGICLMLGLLHILLWISNRKLKYLLSATMALSAAACALLELAMSQTSSIPDYQILLQYQNLFVYILLISMVWLVYIQWNIARRWMAYAITSMWSIGLINNFISPGSLVYIKIDELKQHTVFWGEPFSVASGIENPWVWLVNIATLLILIYVIDASVRTWRHGDKQRAGVTGGGIVIFLLFGLIHSILVDTGTIESPYMVSFAYLAMVLAMSYDLVSDAVRVPQLTQEIKVNEKRWRDLLENVQLAVIAIDPKGFVSYTNPFFEKLTGYSAQSLSDKPYISLLPEDEQEEFKFRMEQARTTGPRPHSQWTMVCATGEQRQLALSSVRQTDSHGEFAGILAIGADITDRLNAQHELQQSQRELERLTRASMLGELASALAHELNQPLAAILSNSQAALRFMDNDQVDLNELREILQDIVRDDKRAGEVVHSMRAMLRRGEIIREIFDFHHALNEVVTILHNEFDAQSIQIHIDFPEHLPQLEAGRVEIQQVLMNLLLNAERAIQTTPTAKRLISIQVRDEKEAIAVSIADHGPGINPSELPNIFTAFYSTNSSGMGMGLAICKRIIEAHGGKIWAENNPQEGAEFTFTLPVKKSHG